MAEANDISAAVTATRFAQNFRTYAESAHVQRDVAETLITRLKVMTTCRHFASVLELGCGTGLLTRAFAQQFAYDSLHLMDLAPNCPRFLEDVRYHTFSVCDLNTCTTLPETNLVLSSSCLQWVLHPERLFQVISKALPSGGIFAATAFAEGNLAELALCGGRPLQCPPAEAWREWLERNDFTVRWFDARTSVLKFSTPLDALRHLKHTGVLIPTVADFGAAKRFLNRYEALRVDGTIPLTYTPVLWIAEKQ